jgi:hypothetical protein
MIDAVLGRLVKPTVGAGQGRPATAPEQTSEHLRWDDVGGAVAIRVSHRHPRVLVAVHGTLWNMR